MTCATCGCEATEWGVERGDWKVCVSCFQIWKQEHAWIRVDPDAAHAFINAGHEVICGDCGERIRPGGPIRVFVSPAGEIVRAYCGLCVKNYIARRRMEAIKNEIVVRAGRGRSKGLLTKEFLLEGRRLADVRLAFEELLADGDLVQFKGIVRRPSRAKRKALALF